MRSNDRSDGQHNGTSPAGERDRPLTFHWRTRDADLIQALGVSHSANKDFNSARNSILIEAALTSNEDRWVSYSRRKAFYAGLRRYHGTAYTFTTVLLAVEELCRHGLLKEQRSSPGQRGHQSCFRATPKLVEGLAEAEVAYEWLEQSARRPNDDDDPTQRTIVFDAAILDDFLTAFRGMAAVVETIAVKSEKRSEIRVITGGRR
jgi:hypothetical protein